MAVHVEQIVILVVEAVGQSVKDAGIRLVRVNVMVVV